MNIICIVLIFGCFVTQILATDYDVNKLSVIYNKDTKGYDLNFDIDKDADAYGYYYMNYNSSGWNHLDVFMNEVVNSVEENLRNMKAIGFVEVGFII